MLFIKNLQRHLRVALLVSPNHPQVLAAFPPRADLHPVVEASPVAVEALAVAGAAGAGKPGIHFYYFERRMAYICVL